MKKSNQYRASGEDKVKSLVSGLSYGHRLRVWALSHWRWSFARRFALVLCLLWAALYGVLRVYEIAFEQTQQLRIEHIDFSSHGILSQQVILDQLGIKGDLRVTHLDTKALSQSLQEHPLIAEAEVYTELPSTLHIKVREHLPLMYVRQKNDLKGAIFFMDPQGYLFPIETQYHQDYLNSPVWYVEEGDFIKFAAGQQMKPASYEAIVELVSAVNAYELSEIPRVREITRPKAWKIVFTLETGSQVIMKSFELVEQVKRLYEIVEHARASNKQLRSVNVIPEKNPAVTYF